MRIRSIKPEWLDDELLTACSSDARVLSIALILLADDHGNGRASERFLSTRVFPGRRPSVLKRALDELEQIRFVNRYDAYGQAYFSIRNWRKHQKVDKPSSPRVPLPSESEKISQETPAITKVINEILASPREAPPNDSGGLANSHRGIPTWTTTQDPDLDQEAKKGAAKKVDPAELAQALAAYQEARKLKGKPSSMATASDLTAIRTLITAHGIETAIKMLAEWVNTDEEELREKGWPLAWLVYDFRTAQVLDRLAERRLADEKRAARAEQIARVNGA